jgi:tetratricopeptide (TPR) repeat protein
MITMTSEIERIARKIANKPLGEIEKTVQEIKKTCDRFFKLNADLIDTGKELDIKTTDRISMIGNVLKEFRVKSAGIEGAWRLNEIQFRDGGLERDAYERKLRELTQDMASLKFDFDKCELEVEAFERQLAPSPYKGGASAQPEEKQRRKPDVAEPKQTKAEDIAKTMVSAEKEEVGAKDSFGDPEAYMKIGLSYEQSGKPEKAKECFESALSFKPFNATIWFHLGHVNSDLGNQPEAVRCYQKVLETNPKHLQALCELGYSYGQMGKHKQARKCYEKLLDINPNDPKPWIGLGVASYSLGQFKKAKDYIEKALQINPQLALAWYNLGLVYSSLGYRQEAERCYNKAKVLGYVE